MQVKLYSKDDCGLCDEAIKDLQALQREYPHELLVIDIEEDDSLQRKYAERIPVVEVGPYKLEAPFDRRDLQVALAATRDSMRGQPEASKTVGGSWARTLNRGVLAFARHWLAVVNLLVFLYMGLPFAAPLLMQAGVNGPARLIYKVYSPLCHQLAYRSWFMFGEQPAYPAELAGVPGKTFEEATGISPQDLWVARDFIGNGELGYKVALCERDVAIYGGILGAGLLFGLVRSRLKPLPIALWFLLGIVPIALDGGTQLISVFPGLPFGARESTPLLRTLTGALFGMANVWMAYPYVEESMEEVRDSISRKFAVARQRDRQVDSAP